MENSSEIDLPELTEDCILDILSFTTPRDVCGLSAISRLFRSAANGDSLRSNFIPQQSYEILPKAVTPVAFSSRRELYFCLCDSVLIDRGTQRFWLERPTGKIGYMLTARELFIVWGSDQCYWDWVLRDDSRLLSEDTHYRVVFVLKFAERSFCGNALPIKFSVTGPDGQERESSRAFFRRQRQRIHRDPNDEEDELEEFDEDEDDDNYYDDYVHNDDEWLEVVAGEFTLTENENEGEENEYFHMKCKFSMREVEAGVPKGGLVLDGVRIEPVNSSVGV